MQTAELLIIRYVFTLHSYPHLLWYDCLSTTSLGAVHFERATFGLGAGAIVLDDIHCQGFETSLTLCPSGDPIQYYRPSQLIDAGVRCQPG